MGRSKSRVPAAVDRDDVAASLELREGVPYKLPPLVRGIRAVALGMDRFRRQSAGELEITVTDLTALGWLDNSGDLRPSELARYLGVGLPAMTAVLGSLERKGFVRRQPHPTDRRSTIVSLTPAGRHALGWVYDQLGTQVKAALAAADSPVKDLAAAEAAHILLTVGLHLLVAPGEE